MTDNELKKLGIFPIYKHTRLYGFHLSHISINLTIPKGYTAKDVLELIYQAGVDEGVKEGKRQKINQIRGCLEIGDL